MVYRGSLYVSAVEVPLGTINREEQDLQCGLWDQPIPLRNSEDNVQAAIFGRRRTITIQGEFVGTQYEIEQFLLDIDDWINTNGTTLRGLYYPLFHKDNSAGSAASGFQDAYYSVLPQSFTHTIETNTAPAVVRYTLIMIEGTKVV